MLATVGRRTLLLMATATALGLASGVAWAASAHFVGKVTASLVGTPATDAQVCWKEAGLGDNQNN
jgi:hypothetical protein